MSEAPEENAPEEKARGREHLGAGIAIGTALGAAFGATNGDMAQSVAIGTALGVAFGAALEQVERRTKQADEE